MNKHSERERERENDPDTAPIGVDRDLSDRDLANRDRADRDRNLAYVCPDLMIFFWVLFVFWGMNDIMYSFGNRENVSNK